MHYWWDTHASASVGNGLILRKLVLTCGLAVPLLVCTILDLEYRVETEGRKGTESDLNTWLLLLACTAKGNLSPMMRIEGSAKGDPL